MSVLLLPVALVLAAVYLRLRRRLDNARYQPRLAWLRAGLYFCASLAIADGSGVLAAVWQQPLATSAQLADGLWWGATLLCCGVVVTGYCWVWPRGTFNDGRPLRPLIAISYGTCWGLCQGLLFLSIWQLVELSGLSRLWVGLISYGLIAAYNGCLHRFFWDIYVSPPHNYTEWNGRKVLLCHTPNLLLCLSYYGLFGNAGIFVMLQGFALASSAWVMRFPSFASDYRAEPGAERSIAGL